jgi:hypothetical protein
MRSSINRQDDCRSAKNERYLSMIIEMEQPITFKCPEGTFRATLVEITFPTATSDNKDAVRFIFAVEVPEMSDYDVRVGITFPRTPKIAGQLKRFLETWLGHKLTELKGHPIERLIGKTADIVTWHGIQREGHAHPFVNFQAYPVGSKLTPEFQFQQRGDSI